MAKHIHTSRKGHSPADSLPDLREALRTFYDLRADHYAKLLSAVYARGNPDEISALEGGLERLFGNSKPSKPILTSAEEYAKLRGSGISHQKIKADYQGPHHFSMHGYAAVYSKAQSKNSQLDGFERYAELRDSGKTYQDIRAAFPKTSTITLRSFEGNYSRHHKK